MKRNRNTSKGKEEFAVIGLGRFGSSVAQTLASYGHYVLGIDENKTVVQQMSEVLPQTVALDATDESALRAVDITHFDTVIVGIGANFENNILVTVALRNLKVKHIICKALTEQQEKILLKIGADRVILPETDAGQRLAREILMPWITEQIDLGPGHSISEVRTPGSLLGRTILEAEVRKVHGVTILVVQKAGEIIVAPPTGYILSEGDTLIVMGPNEKIEQFAMKQ